MILILYSSYIYYDETIVSTFSSMTLYLGGVPTEELEHMPSKLREVLISVRDNGVDMSRMETIVNRDKLKVCEASPLVRNPR